ncbi:MAG: DUF4232 domain-containing protein [Acidimicrobiales bacterium]|nr:DUF4232 domain-containing protein [Acidimicrobiales bacterium]
MARALRFNMAARMAILAAVPLLVAAGCSASAKKTAPTTTPGTTAPSSTVPSGATTSVQPPASSTAVSSPGSTSPANTGPGPCRSAQLAGSLGQPNGAAGTIYYPLTLRNTGGSTCTLDGYPGVSFVTGPGGSQVGAPADRMPGSVATVTLAPGQMAQANLGISAAANFAGSCRITPVAGLAVYPPGDTTTIYIAHSDQGCANSNDVILHVGPLAPA